MKNKKSIYILLPLVVLIWGVLIYQFFNLSSDKETPVSNATFEVKSYQFIKPDTISINTNYRDPFLGKMYSKPAVSSKKVYIKKNVVPFDNNLKPEIIQPSIIYKGIVSDTKDNYQVFMVLIDDKTYLMKKGQTENGLQLLSGNRTSIKIKYNKKTQVITLQ